MIDINNFKTIMSYNDELKYSNQYVKELYVVESRITTKLPQISNAPEKIKRIYWSSEFVFRNVFSEWAIKECRKYGTVNSFLELLYYKNQQKKIDEERLLSFLSELEQMEYGDKKKMDDYYLKYLLHLVQMKFSNDSIKARIIARVELRFFYMLDWDDMICFQKEIKKNPDLNRENLYTGKEFYSVIHNDETYYSMPNEKDKLRAFSNTKIKLTQQEKDNIKGLYNLLKEKGYVRKDGEVSLGVFKDFIEKSNAYHNAMENYAKVNKPLPNNAKPEDIQKAQQDRKNRYYNR